MKSWSSFAVGFVLGVAVAAALFFLPFGMPIPAGNLYVMAAASAGAYGGRRGRRRQLLVVALRAREPERGQLDGLVSIPGGGTVTYGM